MRYVGLDADNLVTAPETNWMLTWAIVGSIMSSIVVGHMIWSRYWRGAIQQIVFCNFITLWLLSFSRVGMAVGNAIYGYEDAGSTVVVSCAFFKWIEIYSMWIGSALNCSIMVAYLAVCYTIKKSLPHVINRPIYATMCIMVLFDLIVVTVFLAPLELFLLTSSYCFITSEDPENNEYVSSLGAPGMVVPYFVGCIAFILAVTIYRPSLVPNSGFSGEISAKEETKTQMKKSMKLLFALNISFLLCSTPLVVWVIFFNPDHPSLLPVYMFCGGIVPLQCVFDGMIYLWHTTSLLQKKSGRHSLSPVTSTKSNLGASGDDTSSV